MTTATNRLPYAPRKSVLQLFSHLLKAKNDSRFLQEDLKPIVGAAYKTTRTLLEHLGVLEDSGRLRSHILDALADREELKRILTARILKECEKAGCPPASLAFLGEQPRAKKDLTEDLRQLPPIRDEKNKQIKSNTLSCMRALHDLLLHMADRNFDSWISDELQALESRQRKPRTDRKKESSDASPANSTPGTSAPETPRSAGNSDSDSAARMPPHSAANVGDADVSLQRAKHYAIGFEGVEELKAIVLLPVPFESIQLRRLAKKLEEEADEMERQ